MQGYCQVMAEVLITPSKLGGASGGYNLGIVGFPRLELIAAFRA